MNEVKDREKKERFVSVWKLPQGDYLTYYDHNAEEYLDQSKFKRDGRLEGIATFKSESVREAMDLLQKLDDYIEKRTSDEPLTAEELNCFLGTSE